MNTVMKTKAEQAYANAFAEVSASLPGDAAVLRSRKAALATFRDIGLPHRRIEEWKYTDLRNAIGDPLPLIAGGKSASIRMDDVSRALGPLNDIDAHVIVLNDGTYSAELSRVEGVRGLSVRSFTHSLSPSSFGETALDSVGHDNGVIALNTAYASDGCVIDVEAGAKIDKPVLVVHVRSSKDAGWSALRNSIKVGDKAEVVIIDAFVGTPEAASAGQINTASEVEVRRGARLDHIKCVREGDGITHLSNWVVSIGAESTYRGFAFTDGVGLARNEVFVTFGGEDAHLNLSGVFLARGKEHIDNTIVVDHKVPSCTSRELFKGVLDGRARGIVQGKVIVRPEAQKTDGKQMAQALMLSPDCEFDSKPELEIYADDVVCGHGSTVDDLDHDLMFYCRSRGIPEAQARSLLIQSFIGEAIEEVENEPVADALSQMVETWLSKL